MSRESAERIDFEIPNVLISKHRPRDIEGKVLNHSPYDAGKRAF